ncbi:hypothetical protein HK097_005059, partial [Rhizophlyctis rosea]
MSKVKAPRTAPSLSKATSSDSTDTAAAEWAAKRLEAAMAARLGFDFGDLEPSSSKKRKRTDFKASKPKARKASPPAEEDEDFESISEADVDSSFVDLDEPVPKGKHVLDDMRSDDEEWDDGSGDEESGEEDDEGEEDEEVESLFATLSSSSKRGSISATPGSANAAGPTVVVFNDPSGRKESSGTAADWRSFMSDKVKNVAGERPKPKISRKEAEQDAEDDQHDRDLMDLLKTTKLVEQYTADELVGRDRRKYNQQKVIELGGKAPKAAKAPLPMRIGFKMGLERIANKKLQEAKDMGMYHSTLKTQIMGSTALAAKQAEQTKRSKARKDKGIDFGFGSFKNGTLHVAKSAIEAVERGPKRIRIGRNVGGDGNERRGGGGGG